MKKLSTLFVLFILFACTFASTAKTAIRCVKYSKTVLLNADSTLDYYPFKDSTYVLSVKPSQNPDALDTLIYMRKTSGTTGTVLWKEFLSLPEAIDFRSEDFNGDGQEDVLIYAWTGARGANEFYHLYVADPEKHTLIRIQGFEEIPNTVYLPEYNIIVGYAYSGENYYIVYRIDKNNVIHQMGEAFKDDFDSDQDDFDKRIKTILNAEKEGH
ncbi:XAC2610-related protein [Sphingobacterium spiritivorum]|uniref:XAC2610-related protein n=1 Tax=Sphingobacterium spiritivorum TaxID=258 RepID=UPI003DA40B36